MWSYGVSLHSHGPVSVPPSAESSSFMANVSQCLAADRWRDSLTFDLSRLPTADNWALQGALADSPSLSHRPITFQASASTFEPAVSAP